MHVITSYYSLYRVVHLFCFIHSIVSIHLNTLPSRVDLIETVKQKITVNQRTHPTVNNDALCSIRSDLCFCKMYSNAQTNAQHYAHPYYYHEQNRTDSVDKHSNYFSNFLSVCCQPKVTRLHFYGSGIRYMKPEVFTQFPCHEVIEFTLESTMISISSSSSALTLSKQHLSKTPTDFNYFIGLPNLIRLRLVNNPRITCYTSDIFTGVNNNLEELYLTGNPVKQISVMDFDKFTTHDNRLVSLDLSYNQLITVEANCFVRKSKEGGMYHLRKLNLAYNQISVIHTDMFSGLPYLEELNLAGNPIRYIEEGSFRNLMSLRKLIIEGTVKLTKNINNDTFTRNVFKDLKDLQDLTLVGLQMHMLSTNVFSDLYQLRRLNLAQNLFNKVPVIFKHNSVDETNSSLDILPTESTLMFPVVVKTKLTHLNLSHNQITCLESNAFQYIYKLKHLVLNFNRITIIRRYAFKGLNSLQILELQGNPLALIQPYAFIPLRLSLEILFLDDTVNEADISTVIYFNRTSLALLPSTTQIYGLKKWSIFRGGNRTIDSVMNSNQQYTKYMDQDVECEVSGKLMHEIHHKIIQLETVPVTSENKGIQGKMKKLSYTMYGDFNNDKIQAHQNTVIILFGSGMSFVIILLIFMMLYRLCTYHSKLKGQKYTTKHLTLVANSFRCQDGDSSDTTASVNLANLQNNESIIYNEPKNTSITKGDSKVYYNKVSAHHHRQSQLFEPTNHSSTSDLFTTDSNQKIIYNNYQLNYDKCITSSFRIVNTTMSAMNQHEIQIGYPFRLEQYDGIIINSNASPQRTLIKDDSYNLNSMQNGLKENKILGNSYRLGSICSVKINSQKTETTYPQTAYNNSVLHRLNQSKSENLYGNSEDDEGVKSIIKELGII
uniref:LRRCT domain-containing protein n=1 Tax=Trichobilharzia regenti TaxID=157069 RepID=A0AA85J3G6_TRIRE|nr:unnamed protein product [Trichobilharzia regenti]